MKKKIDLEQLREEDLRDLIIEYDAKIEQLQARILSEPVSGASRIIQKCPVCKGVGMLPNAFYSMLPIGLTPDASPETCRTCSGRGIV